MDKSSNLEEFLNKDYKLYSRVVESLDSDNNWKRVVSAFKNYS